MSKRASEQPTSTKFPRIEEDDSLSDHEIEFDHPVTLSIRQREFADQFLNTPDPQTLEEDYNDNPGELLGWCLDDIRKDELEEAREAEKAQLAQEEEEEIEDDEEEDEEDKEEEADVEEEEQLINQEEDNNIDGEISQSTKEILDIVYGENIADPYCEYSIKPNSKFPDWVNVLIKQMHGEIPLIKEEFYKVYESEKHIAYGDKWAPYIKYTIIIDNGSTRKRAFEQTTMMIKAITLEELNQFFSQLIGVVDYLLCKCDKTERGCVEYPHYHCILISRKEWQPQRFRASFNTYFGCEEEYVKKNVRKYFYRKMAFAKICGNMSPWCGMTNYIAVGCFS